MPRERAASCLLVPFCSVFTLRIIFYFQFLATKPMQIMGRDETAANSRDLCSVAWCCGWSEYLRVSRYYDALPCLTKHRVYAYLTTTKKAPVCHLRSSMPLSGCVALLAACKYDDDSDDDNRRQQQQQQQQQRHEKETQLMPDSQDCCCCCYCCSVNHVDNNPNLSTAGETFGWRIAIFQSKNS